MPPGVLAGTPTCPSDQRNPYRKSGQYGAGDVRPTVRTGGPPRQIPATLPAELSADFNAHRITVTTRQTYLRLGTGRSAAAERCGLR